MRSRSVCVPCRIILILLALTASVSTLRAETGRVIDLVAKSIRATRTVLPKNGDATVYVSVLNTSAVASLQASVSLYMSEYYTEEPPCELLPRQNGSIMGDDIFDFRHATGMIEGGATKTYGFDIKALSGTRNWMTYYVWGVVDVENNIYESNEMNNAPMMLRIHVTPTNDMNRKIFTVTKPYMSDVVKIGDPLTIKIDVELYHPTSEPEFDLQRYWVAVDVGGVKTWLSDAGGETIDYDPNSNIAYIREGVSALNLTRTIPLSVAETVNARLLIIAPPQSYIDGLPNDVVDYNPSVFDEHVVSISAPFQLTSSDPLTIEPRNNIFRTAKRIGVIEPPANPSILVSLPTVNVSTDGTPDWYKLFVTDPGTLNVRVSDASLLLGVYSQDGQVLETSMSGINREVSMPVFPEDGQWYYILVSAPWGSQQSQPNGALYPASYSLDVSYLNKYIQITGPIGGTVRKGGSGIVVSWNTYNLDVTERVRILFTDRDGNVLPGYVQSYSNYEPSYSEDMLGWSTYFKKSAFKKDGTFSGQLIRLPLSLNPTLTYNDITAPLVRNQYMGTDIALYSADPIAPNFLYGDLNDDGVATAGEYIYDDLTQLCEWDLLGRRIGDITSDRSPGVAQPGNTGYRSGSFTWELARSTPILRQEVHDGPQYWSYEMNLWPEIGYVIVERDSGLPDVRSFIRDRNQSPLCIYDAVGQDSRVIPPIAILDTDPHYYMTLNAIDVNQVQGRMPMVSAKILAPGFLEFIDLDKTYNFQIAADAGASSDMSLDIYDWGSFEYVSLDGFDASPGSLKTIPVSDWFEDASIISVRPDILLTNGFSTVNSMNQYDSTTISIFEKMDLIITSHDIGASEISLNTSVSLTAWFKNIGRLISNASFAVRVCLDDVNRNGVIDETEVWIEGQRSLFMNPGEEYPIEFTINGSLYDTEGPKQILIEIDPVKDYYKEIKGDVDESNEMNNLYTTAINLTVNGGGKIIMDTPNSEMDGTEFWDVTLSQSVIWNCYGPEITGPTDAVNIIAKYKQLLGGNVETVVALARPSVNLGEMNRGSFTLSTTALAAFGTSDGPVQIVVVSSKTDAIQAIGVIDWILGSEQRDDPFESNNSVATASDISFPLTSIPAAVLADSLTTVTGEIASATGRRITNLDKLSNDYYKISFGDGLSVSRGGILTVQIDTFNHDENDLDLTLFNMSGYQDYSRKSRTGETSAVEQIVTYVNPNDGPFYILVNGEPTLDIERYSLFVKVVEHTMVIDPVVGGEVGDEIEITWTNYGNNLANAAVGSRVRVEIGIEGNPDIFEVRLDPSYPNRSDIVTYKFSPKPDMVSANARLRIIDLTTSAVAVSNAFEIEAATSNDYLLITSPLPGDQMQVASGYVIEWTTSIIGGEVNIYFSDNGIPTGGWTEDYFIAKQTENDGQYTLRVPNEVTSNAVLHIEIDGNTTVCDTMDGAFSIITYTPTGRIVATNDPSELVFTCYDNGVLLNGLVAGHVMPRIKIDNSGNETLNYEISYSSSPNWLAAPEPLTGTVNLTSTWIALNVVSRSELAALGVGSYFGQIVISSDDIAVEPVTKFVRLNVIESTLRFRSGTNADISQLPATGEYLAIMSDTIVPITDTLRLYNSTTATTPASVSFTYKLYESGSTTEVAVNDELLKIDVSGTGNYMRLTDYTISALPVGSSATLRLGIDAHDAVLTPNHNYVAVISAYDSSNLVYAVIDINFLTQGGLNATPMSLSFTNATNLLSPLALSFTLVNQNPTPFDYTIDTPSWFTVSSPSGTLNGGETRNVFVSPNTVNFVTATVDLAESVIVNYGLDGDFLTIDVNVHIDYVNPLDIDNATTSLSFTGSNLNPPPQRTIIIRNISTLSMTYQIASVPAWLSASSDDAVPGTPGLSITGLLPAGQTLVIYMTPRITEAMLTGDYTATVLVNNLTQGTLAESVPALLTVVVMKPDFSSDQGNYCAASNSRASQTGTMSVAALALALVALTLNRRRLARRTFSEAKSE